MKRLRAELAAAPDSDRLLALGLTAADQVEVWLLGGGTAPRGLAAAAGLLMTMPMVVRRAHPLVAVAAAAIGFAVVVAASDLSSDDDAYVPFFVILVAAYTAGRYTRGGAVFAGALLTFAFALVITVTDRDGFSVGNLLFFLFIVFPPYAAGVAIAQRYGREAALVRHAAALDAQREQAAAAAVSEERTRIARELHDIVAHSVSTIVVQAQGGTRMVRTEPAEAESAFAAIEHTGRQAMAEMRRLLGVLRATEAATLAPQPGVDQLGELIDGVRAAGLPVDVHIEGTANGLPPGIDVSAYRIVQEALTNTLKHAGPARARVDVRYLPGAIELDISDDGTGAAPSGSHGGHGLVGMRERVAVYGGRLEVGAQPSGGYHVHARLPLDTPSR